MKISDGKHSIRVLSDNINIMMVKKLEQGYSLLEITIAVVIMGAMVAVGIPLVYNNTLSTTHVSGLKTDITAVGVALAYQYPADSPTVEQFASLKEQILEDYYVSAETIQENSPYVDSISYSRDADGEYCVEGSKTHSGETYTVAFSTITGSAEETDCVEINSRY